MTAESIIDVDKSINIARPPAFPLLLRIPIIVLHLNVFSKLYLDLLTLANNK
jgi:hypothetical protein